MSDIIENFIPTFFAVVKSFNQSFNLLYGEATFPEFFKIPIKYFCHIKTFIHFISSFPNRYNFIVIIIRVCNGRTGFVFKLVQSQIKGFLFCFGFDFITVLLSKMTSYFIIKIFSMFLRVYHLPLIVLLYSIFVKTV